jgi:hypothetical protein
VSLDVTLTSHELYLAAMVGVSRHLAALRRGLPDRHGYDGLDGWTVHIEGAAGELAMARVCNQHWGGSINTFHFKPDVGKVEVRTRSRHEYELIVRTDDDDERHFVLVTGRAPAFKVHGYILASDAKRKQWLATHGNRPAAYFVPTPMLKCIADLFPAAATAALPDFF